MNDMKDLKAFPNKFEERTKGQLYDKSGNAVPTLAWIGFKRERIFPDTTVQEAESGDHIPQYMVITPGVLSFTQGGDRMAQLLYTHQVWFSMS